MLRTCRGYGSHEGLMVQSGVTGVGLLQLVPTEEGSFLLFAEVWSLLKEPVGDPALADPWRETKGGRSVSSAGWMLADVQTVSGGDFPFGWPGRRGRWYSPVTWATTAWEIRLLARNDLISSLITALSLLQTQERIYCLPKSKTSLQQSDMTNTRGTRYTSLYRNQFQPCSPHLYKWL